LYRQILEGIEYLHAHSVCHRDIKPSNILMTKDRSRISLVDFNVAKQVRDGENFVLFTKSAGSMAFAAPERLRDNLVYDEKVDLWAAGIVLFMLLVGHHPFDGEGSISKLVEQIMEGETIIGNEIDQRSEISAEVKDLVKCLTRNDPLKRYSAK